MEVTSIIEQTRRRVADRARARDEADERMNLAVGALNTAHGLLVDSVIEYVNDSSLWEGQGPCSTTVSRM